MEDYAQDGPVCLEPQILLSLDASEHGEIALAYALRQMRDGDLLTIVTCLPPDYNLMPPTAPLSAPSERKISRGPGACLACGQTPSPSSLSTPSD